MIHTPTPWQLHDSGHRPVEIATANGIPVCLVHEGPRQEADTAFILKVVNSHGELVAAGMEALIEIATGIRSHHTDRVIERLSRALSQAIAKEGK